MKKITQREILEVRKHLNQNWRPSKWWEKLNQPRWHAIQCALETKSYGDTLKDLQTKSECYLQLNERY